jgi:phosphoheptose isomerase
MSFSERYLAEAAQIIGKPDTGAIERLAGLLVAARERGGRPFILGAGGGAGHASHAVKDFRKIAGIEAYAPTDNLSALTARINDESWHTAFGNWLAVSRLSANDMVLVFSVGGGDLERRVSVSIVRALVGRDLPEARFHLRRAAQLSSIAVVNQRLLFDALRGLSSRVKRGRARAAAGEPALVLPKMDRVDTMPEREPLRVKA